MRLVPASELPLAELAELFTAGYQDYFVPVHVDEAAFAFMVDAWDIDLARSRVALEGEERLGLANLAIRGDRSWIGGIAVVPVARRRGIGRALMEAVLAEATGSVTLEVLEQNEPAIALYRSLGFEPTRLLEMWSLTGDVPPPDGEVRPSSRARSTRTGCRGSGRTARSGAGSSGSRPTAAKRSSASPARASRCCSCGADGEAPARRLLQAARARAESLHYVNVPEGDAASTALAALGGTIDLRQHEMARRPA